MNDTLKLLQRKVFGVPAWVLGLAALGVLAFYLYRRRKTAAAAAAAAGTGSTSSTGTGTGTVPQSSDNGLSGDQYGYLGGWPPQPVTTTPTPVTTPTTPTPGGSTTPTPVTTPAPAAQQTQQGGGWWLGPVPTAIKGTDGNWYQWLSPAVASEFPSVVRYVQIEPNYFVTATGHVLAAGTPQFIRTAAPVGQNFAQVSAPAPAASTANTTGAVGALSAA